jgi:hypothetical protein
VSANKAGEIVRLLLTGNSAVAALVGTRVFVDEAPDDADLPLIVYGVRLAQQIDGSAPLSMATVDVHCYSASDDQALAVATAVDAALNGAGGISGGTSVLCLVQEDWDSVRDSSVSMWGQLLRYGAMVVRV